MASRPVMQRKRKGLRFIDVPRKGGGAFIDTVDQKKGANQFLGKPLVFLLVPRTRIELVQSRGPRDFKSLASTSSATQAIPLFAFIHGLYNLFRRKVQSSIFSERFRICPVFLGQI